MKEVSMPSSNGSADDERQQKVLGMALVVEEVGKESKLVFRYPPSANEDVSIINTNTNNDGNSKTQSGEDVKMSSSTKDENMRHQDNIFFTLPPPVMAKLFRTKPALCGQPMTLLVGGTVFCCRSVLLNQSQGGGIHSFDDNASLHSKQSSHAQPGIDSSPTSLDRLVMFSVIVAVLPVQSSRYKINSSLKKGSSEEIQSEKKYRSQGYPVIRRIHLSLSRLCAVLEREERRCLYMSRQVSMLLDIRGLINSPEATESGISNADGKKCESNKLSEADRMELMITAKPPPPVTFDHNAGGDTRNPEFRRAIPLHGNLASELRDTYHAMEQNDLAFQISPASLLTGRDGIVYINLHIAVIIEAASKRISDIKRTGLESPITLRPYHTILFPSVSAAELLRNISSTGSSPDGDLSQRRLEKLLLVCDPKKTLSDMAVDAALPLAAITESAMSLIEFGACTAAPVITSSTRFACQHGAVKLMSSLRLEFAQQFSHVIPIFVFVAALTGSHQSSSTPSGACSSYVTFGDVKRFCRQAFDKITTPAEEKEESEHVAINSTYQMLTDRLVAILSADQINNDVDNGGGISFQSVESLLMSMTTWVRSHSIIVELKDYFVTIESSHSEKDVDNRQNTEKQEYKRFDSTDMRASPFSDDDFECIYRECIIRNYLDGSISSTALSWRLKMEALRDFRDWGVRENKLQVVTRIPCDADDWGAC